jgi:hypothetical protein
MCPKRAAGEVPSCGTTRDALVMAAAYAARESLAAPVWMAWSNSPKASWRELAMAGQAKQARRIEEGVCVCVVGFALSRV